MTEKRSYPLEDARYGTAQLGALGLYDTAGWVPPPAGQYARFEDDAPNPRKPALSLWPVFGPGLFLFLVVVLWVVF